MWLQSKPAAGNVTKREIGFVICIDDGLTETASLRSMSKNPHVKSGRRTLACIRKTFSLRVPAENIILIIN